MSPRLALTMMLFLLPALTEAQPVVPCSGPLSEAQLTKLKAVPLPRMRQLLDNCGIDFEPDEDAIGRLRAVGMPEAVLDAVRAATGPAARKRQTEQALWESIKDSRYPQPFEDYLSRYPSGQFAYAARRKYRSLKIASIRAEVEGDIEAGLWDQAERLFRDLLPAQPEDESISVWQWRIAQERGKLLRLEAEEAARRAREAKIADGHRQVERDLADGRWDEAEGLIRDLSFAGLEDGSASDWQRRIAEGRERLRLETEEAARRPVPQANAPAGTKKVNPNDGLTYVWIPPGTFIMGCSAKDAECDDDEKPAHKVTITRGYWLGRTPVTQQAYQLVIGRDPSHFKGANLPVESVNWDEAKAYCAVIGGRLPTEAEWEYAARAGSTRARYGNLDEIAWHMDNSGGRTHEVAQKLPNALGLYDMLGNVYQWVADWHLNYLSGSQSDPQGPASGQSRVVRGSSWGAKPSYARVSNRGWFVPGGRANNSGFRCVAR